MNNRTWVALVMLSCMASCASSSGYIYYSVDPVNDKLLAADMKDDLPLLETCTIQPNNVPCVAMLREEYFKMEKELLEARAALKNCQKPNP